ncbi:MAG: putative membrane protein YdjX (TVP38/TMEM64 family) [Halobacteriales archaeon]|jgi:uncharacterized membrane protein YdjX (TVP38/TMEM64 family)
MAIRLSRRRIVGGIVVLAVVCGALLVSPTTAVERMGTVAEDPVLFGAVLLGLYLVRPLFAWPTTPLAVAVGYGYGFLGVPFALGGIALTTIPPFLAVRRFDRGADVGRVGEASERFFAATGGFRGVVAARLAPVPADVATFAAGLGDVRLRTVIAGTVIGEVPWTVVAIAVGASADRLAAGRVEAIGPPVVLAMIGLAAILLAGPARRLLQDRR